MDHKTKTWIKAMDLCSKYWGCHQMPQRSFFLKEYQFPVCARCTGIILGYIISVIFLIFGYHIKNVYCFLFMLPMFLDGTIQYTTKYESNNFKRLLSGLLSGIGFIHFISNLLIFLVKIIL